MTVFTSAGAPVGRWSLRTETGINAPRGTGIAVAPTGEVYVSDSTYSGLKKYVLEGALDETPPETTVRGADDRWHDQPVELELTATDEPGGSGVDHIEVRFQDSLLPVWGPWLRASQSGSKAELTVTADRDHSDDGEHVIGYRAVDLAGNAEQAKQVKVLIDTEKPQVTLRPTGAAQPGKVLITATTGKKATVRFTVEDRLSPEIRYDQLCGEQEDPPVCGGVGLRLAAPRGRPQLALHVSPQARYLRCRDPRRRPRRERRCL